MVGKRRDWARDPVSPGALDVQIRRERASWLFRLPAQPGLEMPREAGGTAWREARFRFIRAFHDTHWLPEPWRVGG